MIFFLNRFRLIVFILHIYVVLYIFFYAVYEIILYTLPMGKKLSTGCSKLSFKLYIYTSIS